MSVNIFSHQDSTVDGALPQATFRGSPDVADISAVAIFSSIGLLVSLLVAALNILLSLLG